MEQVTLVGNLCTAADVIGEDLPMPRLGVPPGRRPVGPSPGAPPPENRGCLSRSPLYSIKCNPHPQVLESIFAQGFGADAASLGEVSPWTVRGRSPYPGLNRLVKLRPG